MKIAVCGCTHGFLDKVYDAIERHDKQNEEQTQLLLCCGDFQAVRDEQDLKNLSCPEKYRYLGDFVNYAKQIKMAPLLTIFIGGNHEVVDLAETLRYGGWVAPNIFYLGHSNVIRVGPPNATLQETLRIGGLSGIYKPYDYNRGYYEQPPYDINSLKSFCHVRSQDVNRLRMLYTILSSYQIQSPVDIFMSHDWPKGIEKHGDYQTLMHDKPFLKSDILSNTLGNPYTYNLLQVLKPRYWFAAHLHTKFSAIVNHGTEETRFLSLDKPYPGRRHFIEFLDILPYFSITPISAVHSNISNLDVSQVSKENTKIITSEIFKPVIYYDLEWLSILSENKENISLSRNKLSPLDSQFNVKYPTCETTQRVYHNLHNKIPLVSQNTLFEWVPWLHIHEPSHQREYLLNIIGAPYDIFMKYFCKDSRTKEKTEKNSNQFLTSTTTPLLPSSITSESPNAEAFRQSNELPAEPSQRLQACFKSFEDEEINIDCF